MELTQFITPTGPAMVARFRAATNAPRDLGPIEGEVGSVPCPRQSSDFQLFKTHKIWYRSLSRRTLLRIQRGSPWAFRLHPRVRVSTLHHHFDPLLATRVESSADAEFLGNFIPVDCIFRTTKTQEDLLELSLSAEASIERETPWEIRFDKISRYIETRVVYNNCGVCEMAIVDREVRYLSECAHDGFEDTKAHLG